MSDVMSLGTSIQHIREQLPNNYTTDTYFFSEIFLAAALCCLHLLQPQACAQYFPRALGSLCKESTFQPELLLILLPFLPTNSNLFLPNGTCQCYRDFGGFEGPKKDSDYESPETVCLKGLGLVFVFLNGIMKTNYFST